MTIPEFDMIVLAAISKADAGISPQKLQNKYGSEVHKVIAYLVENGFATIHQRDLKPFMRDANTTYTDPPKGNVLATPDGKLETKRWRVKNMLTRKERWKERIAGFISGVAITLLGALLTRMLST